MLDWPCPVEGSTEIAHNPQTPRSTTKEGQILANLFQIAQNGAFLGRITSLRSLGSGITDLGAAKRPTILGPRLFEGTARYQNFHANNESEPAHRVHSIQLQREMTQHEILPFSIGKSQRRLRCQRAFTLIELLVTLSIIAILLSLLAPGISAVRARARKFECKMNLRSIAFDFAMFADPVLSDNRGDDGMGSTFSLDTFQESQYRVDEFWDRDGVLFQGEAADLGVMNCPDVTGDITARDNVPCRSGAVGPYRNISYGFNFRLQAPEVRTGNMWGTPSSLLTTKILETTGMVPLAFDINGLIAENQDQIPYYAAPPLPSQSDQPYSDGHAWFPSKRHNGKTQIAFAGGEVLCSPDISPKNNPEWRWDFQDYNKPPRK